MTEHLTRLPSFSVDRPHPPLFIDEEKYNELRSEVRKLGYPDELWQVCEQFAVPLFKGRPGFEHHTWAVVHWACVLADHEKKTEGGILLDPKILITAAILHDIGWVKLSGYQIDDSDQVLKSDAKKSHMQAGAGMARKFLSKVQKEGFLTVKQVDQIVYAISVHDDKDVGAAGKFSEVYFLVAADTLGMMDLSFGKPSFAKEKLKDWCVNSMGGNKEERKAGLTPTKLGRWDIMPTVYAQKYYLELLNDLMDYIEKKEK